MNLKQVSKNEIETTKTNGDTVTKRYYPINSKKGQELIEEHKIIIDPDMEES